MTLHEKLIKVQSSLSVPKGQTNKFGGYKYRSCEDILEALKPLLKEQGLVLTLTDEVVVIPGGAAQAITVKEYSEKAKSTVEKTQIVGGDRFYVKATATLGDGENDVRVSAYAREEQDKRGMDGSQITGAASSYARKYALNGLFCIDDTKDSDATNQHDKEEKTVSQAKTPPKTPVVATPTPPKVAPAKLPPSARYVMESFNEATTKDRLDTLHKQATTAYAWAVADLEDIETCYKNCLTKVS